MARNREALGWNGSQMLDAGRLLAAQRAAAENAAHMTSTACHYVMSMNRAWLNLWSNQLSHCSEIPERLAEAQAGFMQQAFDHYEESMQQMSGFAMQAEKEAKDAMREARQAGERAGQQFRSEAKDLGRAMGKINRPKEGRTEEVPQEQRQRGSH
jgi:hypothetical protein